MSEPKTVRGTEICITVEREGVFLYGNRQAFTTLARWMERLASSPPAKHDELHVTWHIDNHWAKRRRIWVLFDKITRSIFRRRSKHNPGFEVTFMVVEPNDLRRLRAFEGKGLVPRWWRTSGGRPARLVKLTG